MGAGAKTRADMYQAFELIYPVLQSFKKGAPTAATLPALPAPLHQVLLTAACGKMVAATHFLLHWLMRHSSSSQSMHCLISRGGHFMNKTPCMTTC